MLLFVLSIWLWALSPPRMASTCQLQWWMIYSRTDCSFHPRLVKRKPASCPSSSHSTVWFIFSFLSVSSLFFQAASLLEESYPLATREDPMPKCLFYHFYIIQVNQGLTKLNAKHTVSHVGPAFVPLGLSLLASCHFCTRSDQNEVPLGSPIQQQLESGIYSAIVMVNCMCPLTGSQGAQIFG